MSFDSCRTAVLTFADIKAAVEDFDRGDSNLFAALDRIRVALSLLSRDGEPHRGAECCPRTA